MKTQNNSISTAIWTLGISIAISIVFLIIAKVFADNWDAAITIQNSAVYSYAHFRTLYPFLTWSIAGALMLASAIAVIYRTCSINAPILNKCLKGPQHMQNLRAFSFSENNNKIQYDFCG